MSKKKRSPQSRDAPEKRSESWLCSVGAYNVLTAGGYTKLTDCPEVRMCVHIYADLISSMTLHLMQNTAAGDIRVRNELARKLDVEPHPLMTRKQWMYNIVWTLMTAGEGNQITYPIFDAKGYLVSLNPLRPSGVTFAASDDGYLVKYGDTAFKPDEVLHFAINPNPETPWIGTGFKAALRDVVKGIRQAGATKQKLLESPAPSIIVKVDGLTEEFASADGRKALRKQYIDSSENGEPWFIPSEAFAVETVKPLTINDLAIKDNVELDKRTVAGIFGVPPFLVGVGSFSAEEYNNFIGSRVMAMAKVIEQELTRKLLYASDLYWRFNPRSLYSYSLPDIITAGQAMVDRAAMTRNEWRDWVGMGPRADMEEIVLLENYLPIDRLGDQKKLNGGEKDE